MATENAKPKRLDVRQGNILKLLAQFQDIPFDELLNQIAKEAGVDKNTFWPPERQKAFKIEWRNPSKERAHG